MEQMTLITEDEAVELLEVYMHDIDSPDDIDEDGNYFWGFGVDVSIMKDCVDDWFLIIHEIK